MKKIILSIVSVLVFSAATSFAWDSVYYRTGYRADIGIGALFVAGIPAEEYGAANFETVHGYSFGNGLFAGAGVAYMKGSGENGIVPIFAEGKWDCFRSLVTPFVAARVGAAIMSDRAGASFYFSPMAGMEIWRFSLAFNYTLLARGGAKSNIIGGTLYFNF